MHKNKTFFDNGIANLPTALNGFHVGLLAGCYRNHPAVILGAGPSLTKDLEGLKSCKPNWLDHCLLIASDAAVRACSAHGIDPHAIATCDPQAASYRHIENYYGKAFLLREVTGIRDVFSGISVWSGLNNSMCGLWACTDKPLVNGWGSVSSFALGCAHLMGCNPIIFMGLDCSSDKDGWSHHEHCVFLRKMGPQEENHGETTDVHGNTVITSKPLLEYAAHLSQQSIAEERIHGTKHYNATYGGIWKLCERISHQQAAELLIGRKVKEGPFWNYKTHQSAIGLFKRNVKALSYHIRNAPSGRIANLETIECGEEQKPALDILSELIVDYRVEGRPITTDSVDELKEYAASELERLL